MKTKVAQELVRELPLDIKDAARLVLEVTEELGQMAEGLARVELIQLVRRVIKEGVKAVALADKTVTLEEAAWASVEARRDRRPVTLRDLRHYVRRLLRVGGVGERPLRAMSTQECRDLLEQAFSGSRHSYRKGRAILHSIFAYGYRREWCDANPVDRIETPQVLEREIIPLQTAQVQQLMKIAAEPEHKDMLLSLHLMTFCGIRPTEVRRLNPATDIDWQEQRVIIRPMRSKTGGGRVIPLRGADMLRQWRCPLTIPKNWTQRWRRLRLTAHWHKWRPDTLRHTFASNYAAYFRNLADLQLEMGHRDVNLLRSRYINPLYNTPEEVRSFWGLIGERNVRAEELP